MAQKKDQNMNGSDNSKVEDMSAESSGQQMLGKHRDESADERPPSTYHFSKDELEHPIEKLDTGE